MKHIANRFPPNSFGEFGMRSLNDYLLAQSYCGFSFQLRAFCLQQAIECFLKHMAVKRGLPYTGSLVRETSMQSLGALADVQLEPDEWGLLKELTLGYYLLRMPPTPDFIGKFNMTADCLPALENLAMKVYNQATAKEFQKAE